MDQEGELNFSRIKLCDVKVYISLPETTTSTSIQVFIARDSGVERLHPPNEKRMFK